MITITRGVLMESKAAIDSLGKVYVPVGKERYWFIKLLSKLQMALKREGKNFTKESNRLIEEFGTEQPNKRKGIQKEDVDAMDKYNEGMEAFSNVSVTVDVKPITLTQLQEAQVTLQAGEQVALMWLLAEE